MEKHHKTVLIPISDTLPGPGAFEAELTGFDENKTIPVLQKTDSIESLGHGTAKDVISTSQAPYPKDLHEEM